MLRLHGTICSSTALLLALGVEDLAWEIGLIDCSGSATQSTEGMNAQLAAWARAPGLPTHDSQGSRLTAQLVRSRTVRP